MKVAGYCEKVAAIQDKRSVLYHSFEEALLKLKANKDSHGFQSAIKKIAGKDFRFIVAESNSSTNFSCCMYVTMSHF